jgi:hypothetical protein
MRFLELFLALSGYYPLNQNQNHLIQMDQLIDIDVDLPHQLESMSVRKNEKHLVERRPSQGTRRFLPDGAGTDGVLRQRRFARLGSIWNHRHHHQTSATMIVHDLEL